MNNRFILTPLALAGALLGASVGAFAQPATGSARAADQQAPYQQQQDPQQQQQPDPQQYQQQPMGPDGQQMGPNGQQGQYQGQGQQHRPSRIRMALRTLALSPDQRSQIKDLMRQFRASKQTSTPMTRQQMIAQIRNVLTPDQVQQFQAAMHRRPMGQNGQNGQMNGGGFGPQGPQGQPGQPGPGYGPDQQQGPNQPNPPPNN